MKNKKMKFISLVTALFFMAGIVGVNVSFADDDDFEKYFQKAYKYEKKNHEYEKKEHKYKNHDDDEHERHEYDDDDYKKHKDHDHDDDEHEYKEESYIEEVVVEEIIEEVIEEVVVEEIIEEVIEEVVVVEEAIENLSASSTDNTLIKDSDGDGVIDELDRHPGEDDFAYMIDDKNQNGVADDLENL